MTFGCDSSLIPNWQLEKTDDDMLGLRGGTKTWSERMYSAIPILTPYMQYISANV